MLTQIDKIFDFNIHVPDVNVDNVTNMVDSELTISEDIVIQRLNHMNETGDLIAGNYMIFNPALDCNKLRAYLNNTLDEFSITQLVDPKVKKLPVHSVDCIKFHAYQQNITSQDYSSVVNLCRQASDQGKIICLDTSYGSSKMYKILPMELACEVAATITNTPIVLLHSGASKCLEAGLLADSQDNIILDTSFILDYYWGSPVIQDLEFVYNKLGSKRIIFGTDSPYGSAERQVDNARVLFNKIFKDVTGRPDAEDQKNILYNNAISLLNL